MGLKNSEVQEERKITRREEANAKLTAYKERR
jgi:hypothetical protein